MSIRRHSNGLWKRLGARRISRYIQWSTRFVRFVRPSFSCGSYSMNCISAKLLASTFTQA